jgi:hypothetical protein
MSNPLGDAQDKVQDLSKDVSSMSEQVSGESDEGSSTGGGTTNPGMLYRLIGCIMWACADDGCRPERRKEHCGQGCGHGEVVSSPLEKVGIVLIDEC